MKRTEMMILVALLLIGCGQSYEETKRISREQRREMARKDSAALKIAVMPTLDCLPLFVAQQEELLDTLHGGVRLKMYKAQI
jgi:NitT/TauT family transport system substrate-binding protein